MAPREKDSLYARLFPVCPQCAEPVAFRRTQWRVGRPFSCEGCGEAIIFDKPYGPVLGLIVAYFILKPKGESVTFTGHLPVILLVLAAALLWTVLRMKPRRATAEEKAAHKRSGNS